MRYVFFDLDGTLVDTARGIEASLCHALGQMGEPIPDAETRRRFLGPPLSESFVRHCGFSEQRAAEAVALFRAHYARVGKALGEPYDGVAEMLARLKAAGLVLAVATSKPTAFAEAILDRVSLSPYFLQVMGSGLDNTRASKKEVIASLLQALAIDEPSGVVMVGDRVEDLLGAEACGTQAIGVTYGYGCAEELAAAPHLCLADTPLAVTKRLLGI